MPINWLKAEQLPNKDQKVDNQYLLDLRSKVNGLESELALKKKKVSNLLILLTDKEEENIAIKTQLEPIKEKYEELKKEKVKFLTEIAQLVKSKEQLKGKIAQTENSLKKVGLESYNATDLQNHFSEKEKKISELETELKNKVREFESAQKQWNEKYLRLEVEIEKLKSLNDKIRELETKMENAEDYIQLKIRAVNNLNDQIKRLDDVPKILEKIKHVMELQGFLNEKDLERLLYNKS